MNMNKAMQFLLRGLLMTTMLFAVSAVAQDAHTTGQFQGPKANKGHVTHSTRDGKSVLTLSDDFVVPDTPDPHWQVVDSDGQIYLLDKLKNKAFGMFLWLFAIAATAANIASAQTVDKKTLTLQGAERVIAAAKAEAQSLQAPGGVIAVVDDGGNLMALERLDGTFAAGANISIGKARTSVLFKRPTKVFEDIIKNGRTAMVALPDSLFTPLQGGIPIVVDGQIVGGVGVSGASSAQQDEELAIAGANSLSGDSKMGDTMQMSRAP